MLHNFDKHFENNHEYETEYLKVLYYDLSKNHKETYKSYQYNRFCTIIEGTKHVNINNGKEFDYSSSEFILLPPNSSVDMEIKEHTIAVVYEISDKLIEDIKNRIQVKYETDLINPGQSIIKDTIVDAIKSPIQRINQFCMSKDPNKAFLIDLCSQELAYNLIKNHFIPTNKSDKLLDPVAYTLNFLREHISLNVSIQEIAAYLNMSTSNLSSSFKKRTGMTPKEYHNHLKLKKSKEELKQKNVTEVCYALGFENISYFINLFKKYYGETPKQYSLRIKQL